MVSLGKSRKVSSLDWTVLDHDTSNLHTTGPAPAFPRTRALSVRSRSVIAPAQETQLLEQLYILDLFVGLARERPSGSRQGWKCALGGLGARAQAGSGA